jgi:hypothetical protein
MWYKLCLATDGVSCFLTVWDCSLPTKGSSADTSHTISCCFFWCLTLYFMKYDFNQRYNNYIDLDKLAHPCCMINFLQNWKFSVAVAGTSYYGSHFCKIILKSNYKWQKYGTDTKSEFGGIYGLDGHRRVVPIQPHKLCFNIINILVINLLQVSALTSINNVIGISHVILCKFLLLSSIEGK